MARPDDIQELFGRASQLPAAERRGFVLRSNYTSDVQQAALELLEHHVEESGFLQRPAVETFAALAGPMSGRVAEFRLLREVGRGGMGVVYLAEDAVLDRQVALKILGNHLTGSPTAVARFQREAKAAARLNHPAIVPIYRYGEDSGVHFIAMEFVEGETLDQRLRDLRKSTSSTRGEGSGSDANRRRQRNTMPQRTATTEYVHECTRMTSLIAQGLDFAHQAGVLHCDIKPSNILINVAGHPRITDFGIARLEASERLTKSGDVLGSVHYMSPEQLASKELDRRTDVFSLGVVLYEMLTLAPPFYGEDIPTIADSLRSAEPRSVKSFNPMVSNDLETICQKALEKKPGDRYPTAAHFAADLQCYLRGERIMARPPTVARRVSRWLRARRSFTLSAMYVLGAATLATAGGLQLQGYWNSMARMSVRVEPQGTRANVYLRRWDPQRNGHALAELLGMAPIVDRLVDVGTYRLVVVPEQNSGRFVELDVLLLAGESRDQTVTLLTSEPSTEGMVEFPSGSYVLAHVDPNAAAEDYQLFVAAFKLSATEVTNSQYKLFVEATGHDPPRHWATEGYDPELESFPVTNITWGDAQAYATWCGKRLPTAVEWEAAARSPYGRLYPWGRLQDTPGDFLPVYDALVEANSTDAAILYNEYRTRAKGASSAFEMGSPNGLVQLLGSVLEFTSTVREPGPSVVLKGSTWFNHPKYFDLRRWSLFPRDKNWLGVGFRCARSLTVVQALGEE